jgi:methyl-accepting chemotaxis protein
LFTEESGDNMNFNHLKISVRMAIGFGVMFVLMLVTAALATFNLRQSEEASKRLLEQERQAALADEWVANTQLNVNRVLAVAKSQANPVVDEYFKPLITQTTQDINTLQKKLEETVSSDQGKNLLATIGQLRKTYIDVRKTYFDTLKSGDTAQADAQLANTVLPAAQAYIAKMRELAKLQHEAVNAKADEVFAQQEQRIWWLNALVLLAVLGGMVVAWAITRSVTKPLAESVAFARGIASGRLDQVITVVRKDEVGALLQAFADMNSSLSNLVRQVQEASGNIEVSSSEVAVGTQDLASRTEAAASNLEQTASSMEELTATVRQSADAARQANQLASTAADVAQRGGQVVSQVVTTMQDINQSSQKIADIIGVIDSIAFQTNILALNAAVEAARAGEAGRGFAVVASEVRSLAGRSAQAAKEIKDLINASVDKVQSGTQQVQDAGNTMTEIVASVQRVTDVIGEITAASGEQSDGIAQVNVAVNQLDQMTQQNAALVEQSTAAAESLKDQARKLSDTVSVFKISGAAPQASAPTRSRALFKAPPPAPKAPPRAAAIAPPARADTAKKIAAKPAQTSAGGIKGIKHEAKPAAPAAKRVGTPPAPAAAKAPAAASASRVVKAPASDDGDWESF